MKKIIVLSVISIMALLCTFAGTVTVSSYSGESPKSQSVTINATCYLAAYVMVQNTLGYAYVDAGSGHAIWVENKIIGSTTSNTTGWNGSWTTVQLAAGTFDPIHYGVSVASIIW
jgi:hypothetical protein